MHQADANEERFEQAKELSDELKLDEAEAILLDLLKKKDPGVARWKLFLEMGDIKLYQDDFEASYTWLKKAWNFVSLRSPSHPWPDVYRIHFYLGQVERARGNSQSAAPHFKRAMDIGRRFAGEQEEDWFPTLALSYARSLEDLGDYAAALWLLDRAYKVSVDKGGQTASKLSYLQSERVICLVGTAQYKEALSAAERVRRSDLQPSHRVTLGLVVLQAAVQLQEFQRGLASIDELKSLPMTDEERKELHYYSALIYRGLGNESEFRKHVESALSIKGVADWVNEELGRAD